MNTHTRHKRTFRIAGLFIAFLLLTVIAGAQGMNTQQGRSEMTSLKKLVLGIDDADSDCPLERKCLEKIDFEMYVEREILIERWMHDRDLWMHHSKEKKSVPSRNTTINKESVWELLESDLGAIEMPEEEPEIKLASWMYSEEFFPQFKSEPSSQLEQWMMDPSYWAMKK